MFPIVWVPLATTTAARPQSTTECVPGHSLPVRDIEDCVPAASVEYIWYQTSSTLSLYVPFFAVGPIVQYAALWLLGPMGSNCYATCAMLNASSTCAPAATAGTTYGWQSMNIVVNITFQIQPSLITGQKRVGRCRA